MISMQVKLSGASELLDRLKKTEAGLIDLHTEMTEIGEVLAKFYAGVGFAGRGTAYGKTWAALADSTRAEKLRNWAGKPDLVRRGDLVKGFEFIAGFSQVIVKNKVTVESNGTSYNLAAIMQNGVGRHNLPPRAIMGLNVTLREKIVGIISSGIMKNLEGV